MYSNVPSASDINLSESARIVQRATRNVPVTFDPPTRTAERLIITEAFVVRTPSRDVVLESWRERAERLEREVYALSFAVRDQRTPLAAKVVVGLVVAYAASPVDPIPDFLPVVGYLDELVVLPLGVALAIRFVPDAVMAESRERARDELDAGRARWIVAALAVLFWSALAYLAVRLLLG